MIDIQSYRPPLKPGKKAKDAFVWERLLPNTVKNIDELTRLIFEFEHTCDTISGTLAVLEERYQQNSASIDINDITRTRTALRGNITAASILTRIKAIELEKMIPLEHRLASSILCELKLLHKRIDEIQDAATDATKGRFNSLEEQLTSVRKNLSETRRRFAYFEDFIQGQLYRVARGDEEQVLAEMNYMEGKV